MIQYYNPYFLISTCFGLGKIPKAPGTIGSFVALFITYYCFNGIAVFKQYFLPETPIFPFSIIALVGIAFLLFVIGSYSAGQYSKLINVEDPKEIIIDEIVGQMLTTGLTAPFSIMFLYNIVPIDLVIIGSILSSFILFRLFDIFKPWPINWLDKNIKGGIGIMLDDIMAAIFAIVIYNALLLVLMNQLSQQ
jgi:phosphatidylglycerophosphatase A